MVGAIDCTDEEICFHAPDGARIADQGDVLLKGGFAVMSQKDISR